MSWKNFLLQGSYKGIDLDVLSDDYNFQKGLSEHNYPFVAGAHIEDMNRMARQIHLDIMLWGNNYERKLQQLIPILEEMGSGELIHPIYGSMPNMIVSVVSVKHTADEEDACRISVDFVEDTPNAPFFDRTLSLGFADTISNLIDELFDTNFASFNDYIEQISSYHNQVQNIAYVISSSLKYAANSLDATIGTGLDLINSPRGLIADIQGVFNRLGDLGIWSSDSIVSDWKNYSNQAQNIVSLPSKANTGQLQTGNGSSIVQNSVSTADLNQINTYFCIQAAGEMAQIVKDIFTDELTEPTLTPPQIEVILGDVRSQLQVAIDQVRNIAEYANPIDTIDILKDIALNLQNQAKAVINLRPPLVVRKVEANANLHLIAFRWYGDYHRADELLRLNPQIKHPSFIEQGAVLNAYAR
ncbi:DNA circularization protein [Neisseria sp. Ec49-e6-T10]|uniref:DNA circularization protein n=1 Tax=Neisseria sp. Ec49-e6-T10 TaxID=3140744 RepID=UPI003EB9689A